MIHSRCKVVPIEEIKAAIDLRIKFLGALGRSRMSMRTACSEMNINYNTISRWVSSNPNNHLPYVYHNAVQEWIDRQPIAVARELKAIRADRR